MSDCEILEIDKQEEKSNREAHDLIIDSGEFSDACSLEDHWNITVDERYIR